jgi:hypothetical protein
VTAAKLSASEILSQGYGKYRMFELFCADNLRVKSNFLLLFPPYCIKSQIRPDEFLIANQLAFPKDF